MKLSRIERDDDTIYMLQEIEGVDLYEKAKAIVNFCDKDTKLFEREVDRAILEIFLNNGINIPSNEKSVLKRAFARLNAKGKDIEIVDMLKNCKLDYCKFVHITQKQNLTVLIEDDKYLQVCVRVREIKI